MVERRIFRVGKHYENWLENTKRENPNLSYREITDLQAAWWENQKLDKLFLPAVKRRIKKREADWWKW